MRSSALARPAIAAAAALLPISCDSHALFGPGEMVSSSEASALATYFPPSASESLRTSLLDPIGVGPVAYKLTKGMGTVTYTAAGNAVMTARDFMRVGYLMLHEGDWKGNPIFPASWLQHFTESTAYSNTWRATGPS